MVAPKRSNPLLDLVRSGAEQPVLSAGDLALRPWRADDADVLVAAAQDPELSRWTPMPSPYTEQDGTDYLDRIATMWREGTGAGFAVFTADGQLAGSAGIVDVTPEVAELGYWIAADQRGRGFATAVVVRLSRWILEDLKIPKVELFVHIENKPSQGVALAAGFELVGEFAVFPKDRGRLGECEGEGPMLHYERSE